MVWPHTRLPVHRQNRYTLESQHNSLINHVWRTEDGLKDIFMIYNSRWEPIRLVLFCSILSFSFALSFPFAVFKLIFSIAYIINFIHFILVFSWLVSSFLALMNGNMDDPRYTHIIAPITPAKRNQNSFNAIAMCVYSRQSFPICLIRIEIWSNWFCFSF